MIFRSLHVGSFNPSFDPLMSVEWRELMIRPISEQRDFGHSMASHSPAGDMFWPLDQV
jgi:hypothetical protein